MTRRERERRLKLQHEQRRQRHRERRQRHGALRAAEAALSMVAARLVWADDLELLAQAQRVHQSVREMALSRKLRLASGLRLS